MNIVFCIFAALILSLRFAGAENIDIGAFASENEKWVEFSLTDFSVDQPSLIYEVSTSCGCIQAIIDQPEIKWEIGSKKRFHFKLKQRSNSVQNIQTIFIKGLNDKGDIIEGRASIKYKVVCSFEMPPANELVVQCLRGESVIKKFIIKSDDELSLVSNSQNIKTSLLKAGEKIYELTIFSKFDDPGLVSSFVRITGKHGPSNIDISYLVKDDRFKPSLLNLSTQKQNQIFEFEVLISLNNHADFSYFVEDNNSALSSQVISVSNNTIRFSGCIAKVGFVTGHLILCYKRGESCQKLDIPYVAVVQK